MLENDDRICSSGISPLYLVFVTAEILRIRKRGMAGFVQDNSDRQLQP